VIQGWKIVELGFVDLCGVLRGKIFPAEKLPNLIKGGYGFDGSSCGFAEVNDSDYLAVPDSKTRIELENGIEFFLCNVYKDGDRCLLDSRLVAEKIIEKLKEEGFEAKVGCEIEFYVVDSGLKLVDGGHYMDLTFGKLDQTMRLLIEKLMNAGLVSEFTHHEVGPSQYELTPKYSNPLGMGDIIISCKRFLKQYFALRGLMVTFMPKPFAGKPGNGLHIHLSLHMDGENVFRGEKERIPEVALNFIAGILEHAKGLTAFMASTVNSYKRLVPGFEAPIYICWGYGNRSAMIRIPVYKPKHINRIEIRTPDTACNPYLTIAAMLAAGLDGIKRGLEAPEPAKENLYHASLNELESLGIEPLPENLGEAVKYAESDSIFRSFLGASTVDRYLKIKSEEWSAYLKFLKENNLENSVNVITDWEIREYLVRS